MQLYTCIYCLLSDYRNITGAAIHIRKSTGVTVQNCTFSGNHNKIPSFLMLDSNDTSSADELSQLGIPSGGGINMHSSESTSLEVDNCTFVNNSANFNLPHVRRHVRVKPGGHGGAIYLQLPEVNLSNVSIHDSTFDSNFAEVDGGAIAFSLNGAKKNTFSICRCNFTNNNVMNYSGGALAVELSGKTEKNSIKVEGCSFRQNSAVGGGALSVAVYDFYSSRKEQAERPDDRIVLSNSSFLYNRAVWEGSALGLYSFYPSGNLPYKVEMQNW